MKKTSVLITLLVGFCISIFAEDYETLLNKGKEYESKKEYVYALGYYYDAMYTENALEGARDSFNRLSEMLKKGSDGLELSMWDDPEEAWNKVIKEYHKYFTEFCPYDFLYDGNLVKGELNYKDKTATYSMRCIYSLSEKFKKISGILAKNIKFEGNKESHNWYTTDSFIIDSTDFYDYDYLGYIAALKQEEMIKINWIPYMTFPFDLTNKSKYQKKRDDIAELRSAVTQKYLNTNNPSNDETRKATDLIKQYNIQIKTVLSDYYKKLNNEILEYYKNNGIALSVFTDTVFDESVFLYGKMSSFMSFDARYYSSFEGNNIPYSIQFGIFDKNGSLLIRGENKGLCSDQNKSPYLFQNVTESIINKIERGDYYIRPITVSLNYGIFKRIDDMGKTNNEMIQTLFKDSNELQLKLETINIVNAKEKEQKEREERQRQLEKKNYETNVSLLEKQISVLMENFNSLGFSFDESYCVTEVVPKSPVQKVGIKVGNTIKFSLNERVDFSAKEIIETLDLESLLKNKNYSENEMEEYIEQFLNNEIWIVDNKIMPLRPGDSITCVINNGKKDKTITLMVPHKIRKNNQGGIL